VVKSMLDGIAERTVEAGNGAQALEIVKTEAVDLVLADLGMPVMDGHTLLDRLPATLPAIIITGLDVAKPRRAAALLLKDGLTRERLAFAIGRIARVPR
jgi:CheY-like chemotaxis protein